MATIQNIRQRAQQLAEKWQKLSISPEEVGLLIDDLAALVNDAVINGSSLGIRKTYDSLSAMQADGTTPNDQWGEPLKRGQLVAIASSDADAGKIYMFTDPNWAYVTTVDARYVTTDALEEVENKLTELDNKVSQIPNTNYVVCSTTNSTANKTINILGFNLTNKTRLLVKMQNANTANDVNLSISSPQLDTKPLFYNGERASATNTWEAGAVLDVYYDGANFQATDFQGGADITVDSELSETSTNPVQNKVITGKLTNLRIIEDYLHVPQKDVVMTDYVYNYVTNQVASFGGWSVIIGEVLSGDTITIKANGEIKEGFRYGIGTGIEEDGDIISLTGLINKGDGVNEIVVPTDESRYYIVASFNEVTDDIEIVRGKELKIGLSASDIPLSDGSSVESLLSTKKLQEYIDVSDDSLISSCGYNYITHQILYDFDGWTAVKGKVYGGDRVKFSVGDSETDCLWAIFKDEKLSELVSDSNSTSYVDIPKGQIYYLMAFIHQKTEDLKFIRTLYKPNGIYDSTVMSSNGESLSSVIADTMRISNYEPIMDKDRISFELEFPNLGILRYTDGVIDKKFSDGKYVYTDLIEIPPMCDRIEHNTTPYVHVSGWTLYDSENKFIKGGNELVISDIQDTKAKYIRFSDYNESNDHTGKTASFLVWKRMRDVESLANSGGKKPMLLHIIELGQSLGQGRTNTYMDTRVDTNNAYMFKRLRTYDFGYALGITTEEYNANQDLYNAQFYDLDSIRLLEEEKTQGDSSKKWVSSSDGEQESPASGIVEGILNMYKADGVNELPFKVICTLSGLSGCDIDEFLPGARCFERTCIDIKYAFALANKWGYAYKPVIVYMQGENQSADGESKDSFKASLENVYNGLADYLKKFGVDDTVKMFTYQTYSTYGENSHGVALAQMQLNNETTWCKMCYPNYAWRHGVDGIHLTPQASRAMGNSVGVAIYTDLQGEFETLKIQNVEKDGNNIIVKFNKEIEMDKTHIDNMSLDDESAKAAVEKNWGFFATDASNKQVLTNIEKIGNAAIKITCSKLPAMLTYGFDPSGTISTKTLGGYIRENRVLKGYRNQDDLYLYMPIQQIKQSEFTDKFTFTVFNN